MSASTRDESIQAATIVGKWLTRLSTHHDFLSATPIAVKRAGTKFMIVEKPSTQFASDYGFSYQRAEFSERINRAYKSLGINTSNFPDAMTTNRFHLNLGMSNKYDLMLSLLTSNGGLSGWGIGTKIQIFRFSVFSFAYRLSYAQSSIPDYFEMKSISNDLSVGLYFRLIDIYAGIRHTSGRVEFATSISTLQVPKIEYFDNTEELEYYYGVILGTTLNTRLTLQVNKSMEEEMLGIKFSFHFDSLFPTLNNWFKDPRYMKH